MARLPDLTLPMGRKENPPPPERTLMKYLFKKPERAPAASFFILPFYHTAGVLLGSLFFTDQGPRMELEAVPLVIPRLVRHPLPA